MRLDQYLAERWPDSSRSTWQKRIKRGIVKVNNETAITSKQSIVENDVVVVEEIDTTSTNVVDIPIIYEDEHVTIINKPIGVLTHAKGAESIEYTVADFMRDRTTYNLHTDRPGIIHRLDRDTSGILIAARDADTARMLQKQFQDRRAKKTYFAVVDGIPKEHEANIELPIARNPNLPSQFRVDANGKSAFTHYTVEDTGDSTALVCLKPTTGRTHQLRVHMAYLNTPIVGDKVYGKTSDRMYLHAAELEITIPTSSRQTFKAQVPSDFHEALR